MMTIYKKLQEARIRLQATPLNKSGVNAFAKYSYFELGDYLTQIQAIFNDIGLTGIVSFAIELAELNIFEHEGDGKITITSPMSSAALKGCHDVQNLGAVQTYQRRYLWQSALEIVEHDALDATTGQEKQPDYKALLETAKNVTQLGSAWQMIPKPMQPSFVEIKDEMKTKLTEVAA
jgi:hypothetical protein